MAEEWNSATRCKVSMSTKYGRWMRSGQPHRKENYIEISSRNKGRGTRWIAEGCRNMDGRCDVGDVGEKLVGVD